MPSYRNIFPSKCSSLPEAHERNGTEPYGARSVWGEVLTIACGIAVTEQQRESETEGQTGGFDEAHPRFTKNDAKTNEHTLRTHNSGQRDQVNSCGGIG